MTPATTTGRGRSPRALPSRGWLLTGLALLVLVLFVVSLAVGRAPLPVRQALDDVLHGRTTLASLVLLEIRLPRALLGVLVGMSLGLAGAAMQGLLRNPLAEPGVVGVSGCAAFGAVLAFYTGLSVAVPLALPLGGIAGALLAVALLALLTGRQASTLTLILAGVALNSLAGALTALALNLAPNPYASVEIIFWLMGSLADRSLHHVLLVLPLMLGGWGLLLRAAQRTGQQQPAGLVVHERSQQVGHHEAHETNGPGHGDRAPHRQSRADDELQLQAAQADAQTARGVLAKGETVEGLGGAEQESPAYQH